MTCGAKHQQRHGMTRSFNKAHKTLDISNLSKGIYSLTLTGGKPFQLGSLKRNNAFLDHDCI